MKKVTVVIVAIVSVFLWNACTPVKSGGQQDEIGQKVEDLLAQMTLEEKVGQMNQYNGFYDATGPAPSEGDAKNKFEHLKKGWVGSVLNVRGAKQVRELQKMVVENSRLGIPLIFGLDVIHGHKTLAPIPLAEAASWDLEAIKKSAEVAATEASAVGINWTFAPMVDISRDARWGRVMEGAGEDPYLGAKIGVARVKGFQGEDLSAPNSIAACAKHFAGYGFAEAGRDYNTVDISTSTLFNVVLPPFKAAVQEADVKTVMNAFNIMNGVPSTGNAFLQRDILKGKWGFNGFVISDWGSCMEMIPHGMAADLKEAAMIAANAGSDMDMESYAYVKYLADLVREGKVSEDKVDDAVRRILRVKFELGLFDDPYKYCSEEREKEMLYHQDHQDAVLDMARKSIVLLKNDGGLLPLDKKQSGIAVIGALANDKNSPLGSWRIGSDDNTAVSVLEGLDKYCNYKYAKGADVAVGDVSFTYDVTINETDKSGFAEAIALAKKSKVVVMVLGEHGFMSGEGRSRANIDLPGVQQELLEAVYKVNKNIVLVLMNGRPLALPWAAENIPTIVEAWQLGTQSGNAIADVLFGTYNPSGKLTMSFPRTVGQCPIYYNHYSTGRPDVKKEVFWSHYTDEENSPLFPFGYGLSYSKFEYSDLKVDDSDSNNIKVSVKITNTSNIDGEEVVQLYIHDKAASIVRPVKELKGFEKITLKANESKTVEFAMTEKELGFYDIEGNFVVEPGAFDVMVGTNSQTGLSGSFDLK
ncbi:beta-glucosidase BglX [Plebeiibacterium sediminum]|uniref:beta-glucosidase n=1 Tax=Plebeiibacterium sediminum TaxID=2992112 RepID=A0AAE3SE37_9BACT|nr:beta-glucosidase BglX [Plebeiobacterium sediminum]MCW3785776.1 beta-glucosidase BglX [Plebeiobacterium sediminum]